MASPTRRYLGMGMVGALWATLALSAAATPVDDMMMIQSAKIGVYRWMGSFFLYQADARNPATKSENRQHQDEAAATLNATVARLGALGLRKQGTELRQVHDSAVATHQENLDDIARHGIADNAQVTRMLRSMQQTVDSLERSRQALANREGYRPVPEVAEARHLAVLMQYLDARYLERSTSVINVSYTDMAGSSQRAIDELARDFSVRLAKLQRSPRHTAATEPVMRNVMTKWRFIERSLINWQENVVPFVVHQHTASMVRSLNQIAETLERGG